MQPIMQTYVLATQFYFYIYKRFFRVKIRLGIQTCISKPLIKYFYSAKYKQLACIVLLPYLHGIGYANCSGLKFGRCLYSSWFIFDQTLTIDNLYVMLILYFSSGEASPTIYSCYVIFLELMVCKNNQFLKK